ncbi:MAG: phosphate signaling complex protein PhoU [Chloroflexia bacterium]
MGRQSFEQQLQKLQEDVLVLGSMVENAITEAVAALKRRDLEASRRLVLADREINEKRFAIEAECLTLIATQQPLAGDLRTIAAVLEIATELERIGDYAKGIARISLMIGTEPLVKPLIDIPRMAEKTRDMLHRALEAFIRRDAAAARAIPEEDSEIDALYNQVYRELLTYIIADPRTIDGATHLLWAAHNLERTGDRVTNICERVIFTVTGEMTELDVKEEDLRNPLTADIRP